MAVLTPTPKQQIFGSDGAPLVGGKIYTYAAGTSTPIATYTDYSAGTANTNPIILDSYGQANIWLLANTSYKFIVKTAADVLLYTVDNIVTPIDITSFASPPPIGDVTPNTGSFTALTASGAVTFTGTGATKINAGTTAQRPSPSNGMIRYNTTTAALEGYINSVWANIGDVTLNGVQTLTNKTLGAGTVLPAGSVLQVVSTALSASASTTSTSFVASTLVTTITPTFATSKILVLLNGGTRDSNQSGNSQQTAMYRNIASAGYSSLSVMEGVFYDSANNVGGHTFNYLDSPATTSSISYQPYFKVTNGGTVFFNSGGVVSLTLMEIAA